MARFSLEGGDLSPLCYSETSMTSLRLPFKFTPLPGFLARSRIWNASANEDCLLSVRWLCETLLWGWKVWTVCSARAFATCALNVSSLEFRLNAGGRFNRSSNKLFLLLRTTFLDLNSKNFALLY